MQNHVPLDRRAVALLTIGHCLIDLSQGAVAALMPFFKETHQLSYFAAAALPLAASLSSSFIQPLFGYFADRVSASWLLPTAILATVGGLVWAAMSASYGWAIVALSICGLGVAAFHPQAARLVHFAGGTRLATSMSYFSVGGGIGFAAAPLVIGALLRVSGPDGFAFLLLPGVIVAVLFFTDYKHHASLIHRSEKHHESSGELPPAQWGAFALLGCTIAVRSSVFAGLNAFLVLYWMKYLGQSEGAGFAALSLVLGSSIIGTLLGGRLADRFGRRSVLQWGMLGAGGLFFLIAATKDVNVALVLLVPTGVLFALASSPFIVLGQQYVPGRVGVASGVTIGLAVSFGGGAALLLGLVADEIGIGSMIWLLAGLALCAAILAFFLPQPKHGSSL